MHHTATRTRQRPDTRQPSLTGRQPRRAHGRQSRKPHPAPGRARHRLADGCRTTGNTGTGNAGTSNTGPGNRTDGPGHGKGKDATDAIVNDAIVNDAIVNDMSSHDAPAKGWPLPDLPHSGGTPGSNRGNTKDRIRDHRGRPCWPPAGRGRRQPNGRPQRQRTAGRVCGARPRPGRTASEANS